MAFLAKKPSFQRWTTSRWRTTHSATSRSALGGTVALVNYSAQYDGTYDNSPLNMKTVYGEVWIKSGSSWKQLWVQETKVK
jgi:hypothetical protein